MANDTIKLTVNPSGGPSAKVVVDDFLKQTTSLLLAVRETARILEGPKADHIRYRIQHLSTTNKLNACYRGEVADFAEGVNFTTIHRAVETGIEAILQGDEIPETINAPVFKHLREFCAPIGSSVSSARLTVNRRGLPLDLKFRDRISKIVTSEKTERGMFVKGMLEAANIHEKSRTFFYLYPIRGAERIICVFPRELRQDVEKAFGKFVRIHGDFKYKWREKYPHEIKVNEIEILPDRGDITDITHLFGAAPNATGELTAEEFVENMRYG